MESEGPYKHYRLCDEAPCVKGSCMACVYAKGRKAERERCLAAIERWRPMTQQSWVTVSEEIEKGGQDAK